MKAGRPPKRWRYVAAFGPDVMLCAGDARIGPLPQRWWAVVERGAPPKAGTALRARELGPLEARSPRLRVASPEVRADLTFAEAGGGRAVEVVSPAGRGGWIWTRKVVGVPARGAIELRGVRREMTLGGVIDDSAGYHERHTAWRWSTGVGRAESGERVGWNLVAGVHDAPEASERTVWIDGEPAEVGPVSFADDLSAVRLPGGERLEFAAWAAREHRTRLLVLRSAYRQPFGTFAGTLPGGLRLAEGYGVMEEHDAWW